MTKIENRGGARPGAGRKRLGGSEREAEAMRRKAKAWAKKAGYNVDDFLLAVIHNDKALIGVDEIPLRDRLTAAKLFKDCTLLKVAAPAIPAAPTVGPAVGLPPMRPDPALQIVKGGTR